jgi:hypothetical protein
VGSVGVIDVVDVVLEAGILSVVRADSIDG